MLKRARRNLTGKQSVLGGSIFFGSRILSTLEERFHEAQPGCLGVCLYTYRVRGIEDYCDRVKASAAQNVTEIVDNEFGEPSFSFVAPDRYFWILVSV